MNASIRGSFCLALLVGTAHCAYGQTVSGPAGTYQVTVPAPVQIQWTPTSVSLSWGNVPPGPPVPTLQSIVVTPVSPVVAAGTTQQFTAIGTYSDKSTQTLTAQATWVSATPSIATIAVDGIMTAKAAGTSVITASLNGISGVSVVTVTGTPLPPFVPPNPPPPPGPSPTPTSLGPWEWRLLSDVDQYRGKDWAVNIKAYGRMVGKDFLSSKWVRISPSSN